MDNRYNICDFCGHAIVGSANSARHIKACKRKLCEKCEYQDTCQFKFWSVDCPHAFVHKDAFLSRRDEEKYTRI